MSHHTSSHASTVAPLSTSRFGNLRFDVFAGFLVFLIAMPLCLAIARASGFPPIAGIWTAVIGGVLTSFLSNAQLTIKGPAAGLIVIVLGAVTDLGAEFGAGLDDAERAFLGYKLALGIGVVAGLFQILLGYIRAGRMAHFFPLTPVHGMLASIGIIIISKQLYELIGASPEPNTGPLEMLYQYPRHLRDWNPEIALIGVIGLLILFGLPLIGRIIPFIKRIPGPLIVLLVAVELGWYFDLEHEHKYLFRDSFFESDHEAVYEVGPRFLVTMPEVLKEPSTAFAFPDFRGVFTLTGLEYLLLFVLIGSLESLLSARAVELLDPWKRKTDFDRDLRAVGVANTLAAMIGALPMISEIVRSKANIDSGARTRAANCSHGIFLLAFVLMFPNLIHQIPLAALSALLIYTGFRLASPREFVRTFKVGVEQFVVFIGTIIATLCTDLLIGITIGIGLKMIFHIWNGAPMRGMLWADVRTVPKSETSITVIVRKAALFTTWMGLHRVIVEHAEQYTEIHVDLSETQLVDHSVMEKLHELQTELAAEGKTLLIVGLDQHAPLSKHPQAARKRSGANPSAP